MKGLVLKTALLSCCAMAPSVLAAQDLPPVEEIREIFEASLPGFWDASDFRVVSSATGGDPVNPKALFRFEASVAPDADLYTQTGETLGPFVIVTQTYDQTNPRTLYGTMELSYHSGDWSGEPRVENPVQGLGIPLDVFTQPPLVQGTEEFSAALASFGADTVAKKKASLANEIDALEARHAAELDRLNAEQQSALEAKERELSSKLDELVATFQPRLDDERERLAAAIGTLEQTHAEEMGALKARQAEAIEELSTGFEERKARLERRLTDAEEMVALQDSILETMGKVSENGDRLDAALEAQKSDQLAFFQSLGDRFVGSYECNSTENSFRMSFPIYFSIGEVTPSGVHGVVQTAPDSNQKYNAILAHLGKGTSVGSEYLLNMGFDRALGVFELAREENGTLVGTAEGEMKFSGGTPSKNAICNVVLTVS